MAKREDPWMPGPDVPFQQILINPEGTRHLAFDIQGGQWFRLWQKRSPQPIGGHDAILQRPSDIDTIIKWSLVWAAQHFSSSPRAAQLVDEVAAGAKIAVDHFAKLAGSP